ncbi:DUF2796 domain-containing protein [Candidatus Thiodiazotropha endoloripes]|uniref:DUF2796 domain-containing protein n=1 Tax=Candidatus Thiodiazotropha endoloripes TaxID=1818881 RepID=UPI0009F60FDA|nr:DUF2796 domain-containing protein [Candidatus Thiodiazotropha endoloripes]MCG7904383.1 DUF2796 domain-containing protein [Candidatus Thiodiazotropha weberae]MCG7915673.1 DUF2796 domain-containing protein [Candidatus Thiodiazotropha weberae]
MTKTNQGLILLSCSLFAASSQLHAADSHHGEHEAHTHGDDSHHEQHEAHVHGEAQLLIALDGSTLELEFQSPAMNIVGFEHQPKSEKQVNAVEAAMDTLNQPNLIFTLSSAAQCNPVSIEVDSPLSEHDGHDHDHEHKHEEESHSDFTAHYSFRCEQPSRLEKIEFDLFKRFPGTEQLEVQSISKKGQQKIDLTPGNNTLEF